MAFDGELDDLRDWGFDLTDFGPKGWPKVIKALRLSLANEREPDAPFRWIADGLTVETNCNPINGEHSRADNGMKEKGYASYIAIKGERVAVMRAVAAIHEHATYIKGEAPFEFGV